MTKHILACASIFAFLGLVSPALAADDCQTRIDQLGESKAEGPERLAEKDEAAEVCATQYKNDKRIDRLVKECAKYEEQAVTKLQALADCHLAAYNYANTLYALKSEYRK